MVVETPGGPPPENVPLPDPSSLTTAALLREIKGLREFLEARINGNADACASAVEELRTQLEGHRNLDEERFVSVDRRFMLVEQQRVEQKSDTKAAVDAAFNAAAEAVKEQTTASERSIAKSETAVKEQLNQLATTFQTTIDGMRREQGDMKDRITTLEQQKVGAMEQRQGISAAVAMSILGGGVLISVIAVVANILTSH